MTKELLAELAEIMDRAAKVSNKRMQGGTSMVTYEFECLRDALLGLIAERKGATHG
jgi:hypothetical protein